jgi:hypothetical protein
VHQAIMVRAIVGRHGYLRPGAHQRGDRRHRAADPHGLRHGGPIGSIASWRRFIGRLPQGELEVVEGGGHLVWYSDPAGSAPASGSPGRQPGRTRRPAARPARGTGRRCRGRDRLDHLVPTAPAPDGCRHLRRGRQRDEPPGRSAAPRIGWRRTSARVGSGAARAMAAPDPDGGAAARVSWPPRWRRTGRGPRRRCRR